MTSIISVIRGQKVGATVLSIDFAYRVPSYLRVPCRPTIRNTGALPISTVGATLARRGICHLNKGDYLDNSCVND